MYADKVANNARDIRDELLMNNADGVMETSPHGHPQLENPLPVHTEQVREHNVSNFLYRWEKLTQPLNRSPRRRAGLAAKEAAEAAEAATKKEVAAKKNTTLTFPKLHQQSEQQKDSGSKRFWHKHYFSGQPPTYEPDNPIPKLPQILEQVTAPVTTSPEKKKKKSPAKKKVKNLNSPPKKRAKDIALRDPDNEQVAMDTRKLGAFIGYEWKRH